MIDEIFAEIDIEPVKEAGDRQVIQSPVLADIISRSKVIHPAWAESILPHRAEPIAPRAADPVRERFYEMRRLAVKSPYPKNDSRLFYRQAKFMEEFTDNFDTVVPFNMYFPFYQRMGYDYLRTYFTWRTDVRSGNIRPVSLSYIFLYIYELLSGIGTDNPLQGLDMLMKIWETFSGQHSAINSHMPKWLKDYHVFYELPHSFAEFTEKYNMQKYYTLTLLFDKEIKDQLEYWNSISGYDITRSRYYREGNEDIMKRCFDAVLCAIQDFCSSRGASLEDMLVYSVSPRRPWRPFKNALFGSDIKQADREVCLSKYERYYCKNNEWTAKLPVYYSSQKDFTGYIIKKTEACLRNATGYKYKLAAEMKPGVNSFRELHKPAVKRAELDRVIEKAVISFCNQMNKVVVTVDHQSLSRIREEALEIQEQLIVEDEPAATPVSDETLHDTRAYDVAGGSGNDIIPDDINYSNDTLTLSFSDGWQALGKSLSEAETETLRLMLCDSGSEVSGEIKKFTDSLGIMLEVLVEGINEKASDYIGDSIMEVADDEIYIFEEYKDNIAGMIAYAGGDK